MAKQRNAFKVGLISLLVMAAAFFILIWISKGIGGDMQAISIRFESSPAMPALVEGSDVFVGGQKVGKVTDARLIEAPSPTTQKNQPPRKTYYVIIDAKIRSNLVLHEDCKVFAEGPPLGGDGIVKLDLGSSEKLHPSDKMIEGGSPGGFAAILAGLQTEFDSNNPEGLLGMIKVQLNPEDQKTLIAKLLQSMGDINAMTASLSMQLSLEQKTTLLAKLHSVADNINVTTASLRAEMSSQKPDVLLGQIHMAMSSINDSLGTMQRVLKNNEAPINRTLASVEQAAMNVTAQTDPNNYNGMLAQFNRATTSLSASLTDINAVTSAAREVVVLNKENLNRMLVNFKEASDHIKSGMKYVLRHPWRLMNAPALEEIKQEAIFDAARNFADAATRIDDATAQLKALSELYGGKIPSDHPELLRIKEQLKQTQDNYRRTEDQLWKQLGVVQK
jgi:hypothetical protein